MAENALAAEARTATGKGVARKLRAAGRIPAVMYGHGLDPRSLSVDPHDLESLLHKSDAGLNTLIDLQVDGDSTTVLVRDLQREPVSGEFLHADFFQINLTERVTVTVPIEYQGNARGVVLDGGILDHPVRELEIECLPTEIPESVAVDVSDLGVGDSIHVSEVPLPDGVTVRTDADLAVASVVAPRTADVDEEVAETEETEAAEGAAGGDAAPAEGDGE